MIKDVEYAFFAQLSYLNWNNLNLEEIETYREYKNKDFIEFLKLKVEVWNKIKRDDLEPEVINDILMYDERDKRLLGVFGIEKDKDTKVELKPYYDFNGWQFIYSADKTKLFADYGYGKNVSDNGFYACAFKKENDVVIAYRGTDFSFKPEDIKGIIKDMIQDIELGFMKENGSQLICAYMFLEYIKKMCKKKEEKEKKIKINIHITGHSLGGCLAQYVYVVTGKIYPTVTFNALGLGKSKDKIKEDYLFGDDIQDCIAENSAINKNLIKLLAVCLCMKNPHLLLGASLLVVANNYLQSCEAEEIEENFINENNEIALNGSDEEVIKEIQEILEDDDLIASAQVYWLLKGTQGMQRVNKAENIKAESEIINYYNHLDWTSLIAPRYGKCIDVLTGSIILNDIVPDTKEFLLNQDFNMTYHGVNDFLLYMGETGKIRAGLFNMTFTKNAMKTMFLKISKDDEARQEKWKKLYFLEVGTKDKTKQQNPFRYFHQICTKTPQFGQKVSEVELSKIKYKIPANVSLSRVLSEYVDYRLIPDEEKEKANGEIGRFIIGQLCNVKELVGIKGGKTAIVDKLGEDFGTMLEKALEEKDNTNTTNNRLNKGYKNLKYAVNYHGYEKY
ncbi:Mbeg1-like protein [uncultured Fusobacterium sp.]|uniref:Mbeg1-like protein n=1 Tax=uncultured Fusobacterium sp. TaxID=159267 RepID=UPI0025F317A8|nr:Mbeg1-like protein [uncultured Fusobacterium sp.]